MMYLKSEPILIYANSISVYRGLVKVEIFAQYIFLSILCMALYARKYDVSDKIAQRELTAICTKIWLRAMPPKA